MKRPLKILVTILARGGSKGIKGKNIIPLMGRPLIAYTIRQALEWERAKRVVVSTDSRKIAEVARRYGAQVPFLRPRSLAKDNTPKVYAIRHALEQSERLFGEKYDIIVDLDVSSPLRSRRDLENCLKIFLSKKPLTLFSVVKAQKNPYFNMVEEKGDGFVRLCKRLKGGVVSRQGAPQVYAMNASIYFYKREFLLKGRSRLPFSRRSAVYLMGDIAALDINKKLDLRFAEFLIKQKLWKTSGV